MSRASEVLTAVADETFMSLAFMMGMPPDLADGEADGPWVVASVEFEGPFRGAIFVRVERRMLEPLAANMLGMEEEGPSEAQQADALKELANVICGNVLPEVAGSEAVFNVQAPVITDETDIPPEFLGAPCQGQCESFMDEGAAQVAMFIEGEVPAGVQ